MKKKLKKNLKLILYKNGFSELKFWKNCAMKMWVLICFFHKDF